MATAAWEEGFGARAGCSAGCATACAADWQAYTWHPFVPRVSQGTLPLPAFRRYLVQDYLFLIHFARAKALAVFKAESIEAMRDKTAAIAAILSETLMHLNTARAGASPRPRCAARRKAPRRSAIPATSSTAAWPATSSTSKWRWRPARWAMARWPLRILADPQRRVEGNAYQTWIDTYADPGYQAMARAAAARIDALGESHGGHARFALLSATFSRGRAAGGAVLAAGAGCGGGPHRRLQRTDDPSTSCGLDPGGPPHGAAMRILVAMSGGVDCTRHRRPAARAGLRRRRRHAAALRPRRGDQQEGRLLRRPGHPRRAPRRRDASASRTTCSTTRAASATPVMRGFRRQLRPRRDADPLHPLQPDGEVPRPAGRRPRPRRRGDGDRPLCPPRRGPAGPELHRAADPARDQSYFLFATTPEQLDFLRFPLGGLPEARGARRRRAARPGGGRQAGQPGHLLRAAGRYTTWSAKPAPGRRRARRHRAPGRPRARPPRGHHPLHGRPAARARPASRDGAEPLFVTGVDAGTPPGGGRAAPGAAAGGGRGRRDELAGAAARGAAALPGEAPRAGGAAGRRASPGTPRPGCCG